MSVSASVGRHRASPPGRYPLRRRFPAGPATSLRRVDRARESRGFRVDDRLGGGARRLRNRPRLQAALRRGASDVSGAGHGGGRLPRRCALVGSFSRPGAERSDPRSAPQQLRRTDRCRSRSRGAGGLRRHSIGSFPVTELRRLRGKEQRDPRRGVWLTLVSDLAQTYFELLALDVRLQIARNSKDAYQRTYDLFLDRFQVGVASKLETDRAEGALGGAEATIPQIESEIVAKENQMSVLLGKNPGPVLRGTPMYDQPVVPTVPAGL